MTILRLLLSTICILPIYCNAFQNSRSIVEHNSRRNGRKNTSLGVSELHVPGYVKSKKPFILKVEHLKETTPEGVTKIIQPVTKTFSKNDFESMIPYNSAHLLHKTKTPLFTAEECNLIVNEAESVASKIEWTKNRHGNFPTTDLPLIELPETMKFLRLALVERVYPMLKVQFGEYLPDPSKLRLADGFVVKYDAAGGQKELKPHRDGSVISFNIALNSAAEFEGGGTWFASIDDAVKIDRGQVVSHSSGLLHGGHGITTGKRYILVGFVILEGYDSWSMRFYNQVRNL